jgi:glycosyltransferase involved in cell wall biosynthesis
MTRPLVSVIINCYNGEKYLKKCVQSIIDQTYDNFEIIFWDNNSIDQSKNIIHGFNDSRIKYFKSKNKLSLGEARYDATKVCKGSFITFLDTDDWFLPERLDLQVKELVQNDNIGLVFTNYYYFNDLTEKKKILPVKFSSKNVPQQLLDDYNVGIITVMIRSEILQKNNFNKNYNFIEDFDLIFRLSFLTKFKFIDIPTAYYRIHDTNISKIKLSEYIEEFKIWRKLFFTNFKTELSFKKIDLKIKFMEIKKDTFFGNRFLAFKKIISIKLNDEKIKKIKYLFALLLPNFLIKNMF